MAVDRQAAGERFGREFVAAEGVLRAVSAVQRNNEPLRLRANAVLVSDDGRPTRWFVQTWYPHPKQIMPEDASNTLTALVKAVIEVVQRHAGS